MQIKKSVFKRIIQEELEDVLKEALPNILKGIFKSKKSPEARWHDIEYFIDAKARDIATRRKFDVKHIWNPNNQPVDHPHYIGAPPRQSGYAYARHLEKKIKAELETGEKRGLEKYIKKLLTRWGNSHYRRLLKLKSAIPQAAAPRHAPQQPKARTQNIAIRERGEALSAADWKKIVRGKVVIDFWEGWCTPCKKLWPHLTRAAKEAGVNIIKVQPSGAAMGHPVRKLIPGWRREWKKNLPYLVLVENGKKIKAIEGDQIKIKQLADWLKN